MPKAALARPLPTRQTRKKGRLNFLYPDAAIAYRRHHWILQQRAALARRDPVDEARMFARMLLDDTDLTEVELVERMLIDAGVRLEPTPGWAAPLP